MENVEKGGTDLENIVPQSLNPLAPIEDDMRQYIRRYLELDKEYKEYVKSTNDETQRRLLSFLEVLDVFDKIKEEIADGSDSAVNEKTKWIKKLDKVHKKFNKAIIKCCVEPVKAKNGSKVNFSHHIVTKEVQKRGLEDGTIVGVVRKGYLLNGKLLRAASVKIVNNKKRGGSE